VPQKAAAWVGSVMVMAYWLPSAAATKAPL